jgi:outer membrane protein OmpA-like peptidoglycan-associated protein
LEFKIVALVLLLSLLLFIPTPQVDSISPNFGLNNEVVNVVINGNKFDNKVTIMLVKSGESDIVATDVKVSKKQIQCSFDLHGQAVGLWDLVVVNRKQANSKGKSAKLIGGFTIQYPKPTVSEIKPDQGLFGDTVIVNISGTGFRTGAKLALKDRDQVIQATDVEVISDTQISAIFDLADMVFGKYDVIVTNDDGKFGSLDGGFEIQYPEPALWEIKPSQGLAGDTVIVELTGSGFRTGAKLELKSGEHVMEATDVVVVSDTLISAVFDLAETIPGNYDVIVTNDDGKSGSLDGGFDIQLPEPALWEIKPSQGLAGDTVIVELTGSGFRTGAKLELKAGGKFIEATDVEVISDTQISAVFDLADAVSGSYDIAVTNVDGQSGTLDGGFEIQYPEPFVTSIEPAQGSNNETVTINIGGAGFRTGAQLELRAGEQLIEATSVEVVSDSQIAAEFDLTGSVPGTYDVTVVNDDQKTGSLTGGFEIIENQAVDSTVTDEETPEATDESAVTDEETPEATDESAITDEVTPEATDESAITDEVTPEATDESAITDEVTPEATDESAITDEETPEATDESAVTDEETPEATDESAITDEVTPEATDESAVTDEETPEATDESAITDEVTPEATDESAVTDEETPEATDESAITDEVTPEATDESAVTDEETPEATDESAVTDEVTPEATDESAVTDEETPEATDESAITDEVTPEATDESAVTDEETPDLQELNGGLKPVFFDYNQYVIRPDQIPGLEESVKILNENPNLFILLGGHADERGSQEYNLGLSEKRTKTIKQFFVDQGIDSARIWAYAYGEDHPVKKGHDESSWSFERRVDISVWESPPTREQGLEITIHSNGEND